MTHFEPRGTHTSDCLYLYMKTNLRYTDGVFIPCFTWRFPFLYRSKMTTLAKVKLPRNPMTMPVSRVPATVATLPGHLNTGTLNQLAIDLSPRGCLRALLGALLATGKTDTIL